MFGVTSAVLHGLLLPHYGAEVPAFCSAGGPLSRSNVPCPPTRSPSPCHCQPPSPPFQPETRHLYLLTRHPPTPPTNLYAWFLRRAFTAIFVPPTAATFQQRLVIRLSEAEGPAPCLPADGWPVGLYLSRTDAASAGVRRLSLLTALSESDL